MGMLMSSLIAGEPLGSGERLAVHYPWDGSVTGEVVMGGVEDAERAVEAGMRGGKRLTRHERAEVLRRAADLLDARVEEHARLIRLETGLSAFDCRGEASRAGMILRFAAMEALREEGMVWPGDVTPAGFARKLFTVREPVRLALAITPFNHPLTQCAHKVGPAIAAGAALILKPSEKTPLTALTFTALLYEAGLPGWMLSCLVGPLEPVVGGLVRDGRIEALTFTGSAGAGRAIAGMAGLKKTCYELGGNAEMIVLEDADMELAVRLGAEGSYRNSGQRCTAVKRFLVARRLAGEFAERLAAETVRVFPWGDPGDEATRVGTVINEAAARQLEEYVREAVAGGAEVLCGGERRGALMMPTVLRGVARTAALMREEAFGPLSPVVAVDGLDEAVEICNESRYGLATSVMTRDLGSALAVVERVRTGMVQVNEVPAWRLEHTPFGGIKESGPGVKEGVAEAVKFYGQVKTFSLPWPGGM